MAKPKKFDPYEGMSAEEKDAVRKSPRDRVQRVAKHVVRDGQIFREGRTDSVPLQNVKHGKERHLRRAAEIQENIDRLSALRQHHLDQAQDLDAALAQADS